MLPLTQKYSNNPDNQITPQRAFLTITTALRMTASAGPDPRKVDTSGVSYAALISVAEVSAPKTSGATRLLQECRRRVLKHIHHRKTSWRQGT
ncbi:hypothetical protein FNY97_12780 [Corynebacterium hiratae]|uniref:Uncharacterized protein n=1 Tax=Corynebacterium hiratae TaxID=3139423 RepID=A0A553FMZ0_9CORY|nr:hypothetical protein FNY97_12780 [Corynebacterium aurimucosum]